MIKFLLIVYFQGTKNYQSIFLFLNIVSNIQYTILYHTIPYIPYIPYIYIYIYIYIVYAPYPIISHEEVQKQSVNIQQLVLINRYQATVSLCDLASFILKNNSFENEELKYHQKRGFAIGTKFAPPYSTSLRQDYKTEFFKTVG